MEEGCLKQVALEPVKDSPDEWIPLQKEILRLLREEIYFPLLKELESPKKTIQNSTDDIISAIKSGRIKYNRGEFKGRFGSKVSKELRKLGAKWDRKQGSWKIPQSSLPYEIISAVNVSDSKFNHAINKINKFLKDVLPEQIAGKLKIEKILDTTLLRTDKKIKDTTKQITVSPTLTPERRAKIAELYTENLERYIKDFTEKETLKLREDIKKHVVQGGRYEDVVKTIQKSYGVSENKAKFLARQETKLMTTALKQERYLDAGVKKYKWTCVKMPHDKTPGEHKPGFVRYDHGKLDGTIQEWNNPPITDEKGNRNNPGEDYNCRCYAIPIVEF